jgi:uncharacterized lipoprotein YbaY
MERFQTIRGEILLPREELPGESVNVIIYVEDISRADAPSIVIGVQRQEGIFLQGGSTLQFQVEVSEKRLDSRHMYSVRVHIDVSKSGEVTVGDFVSTQTYPVLTHGYGTSVKVKVRRV